MSIRAINRETCAAAAVGGKKMVDVPHVAAKLSISLSSAELRFRSRQHRRRIAPHCLPLHRPLYILFATICHFQMSLSVIEIVTLSLSRISLRTRHPLRGKTAHGGTFESCNIFRARFFLGSNAMDFGGEVFRDFFWSGGLIIGKFMLRTLLFSYVKVCNLIIELLVKESISCLEKYIKRDEKGWCP